MYTYNKLPAYKYYHANGQRNGHRNANCLKRKPATNIFETKDEFRVELAVPGLSKKDINIEIENDELRIYAEVQMKDIKDESILMNEFNYSNFERTYSVPNTVDTESINASYNNGILSVNIPKKEEYKVKPPREISVN